MQTLFRNDIGGMGNNYLPTEYQTFMALDKTFTRGVRNMDRNSNKIN